MLNIEIIGDTRDRLGECPLWDVRDQALYWVDSKAPLVHRFHPQSGERRDWAMPCDVGSIALAEPGRLVLALEDGFHVLHMDSDTVWPLASVQHSGPAMRMNDGRTDRQGRFVAGSMVMGRHDRDGALYRLEADGGVTRLIEGIAVANSTCFSPDGGTLYSADSLSGVVCAYDYDTASGAVSGRRELVDTRAQGSAPDGATVDAQGCLWVALVQAGKLGRYAPDGSLLRVIDVPSPFPTCPCFGGADLDVLYLTTIRNTGNLLRSDHPDAGALLAIRGLGVRGLAEVPYVPARSLS
ncbi:MAG TPA: SMP-30/gluconolactonase/LRE family protein [Burkholderiaceae bacterium]|nr:SMP-30/gluconolactonase/LRE family protein [Burkholderiaceae bacterium]